jgi:hypothetical protein
VTRWIDFGMARPQAGGDRVAEAHLAARPVSGVKARSVEEEREDLLPGDLLDVTAGRAEARSLEQRRPEAETPTDEVVQRHVPRGDVATMVGRRQRDLMVAQDGVQGLRLEEGDLAALFGPVRIEAFAGCVAVARDAVPGHQRQDGNGPHRQKGARAQMKPLDDA